MGVWKVQNGDPTTNQCFTDTEHGSYAFISSYGRLTDSSDLGNYVINGESDTEAKYGIACKQGDIIEMHLDLEQFTIQYVINNKDYGFAFKNIENTKYRAAVCVDCDGNGIKLLDC